VPHIDPGLPGFGVLGHVGQQLADREVGGRLDRGRRAAFQIAGQVCPQRAVQGQRPYRVGQTAVGQDRLIEAGWLLALSAIAIAAAIWLVRRRAA
jgi:hypothetical protein